MLAEKLSISLSPQAVEFIETYRVEHAIKSRSKVIERALRRLREDELERAYAESAASADPDWNVASGDGLADEAW
jgi:Arc/MetJ-type ribon-helix-helix transcriptional regulator